MGRIPGAKKITNEQVKRMVELRRKGKSISAIGAMLGVSRQTVRVYLKQNEDDLFREEVRKAILIEGLREHFRELANFASVGLKRRLDASRSEQTRVTGPKVPMPGPISLAGMVGLPGMGSANYVASEWARIYLPPAKDRHLAQALREHSEESDLWLHWDNWQTEVAEYEMASRELLQWIVNKTEPERCHKIDPEYMESVQWWVFGNVLLKASGHDYERLEIRGGSLIAQGARGIIMQAADNSSAKILDEYLTGILEETEQQPQWSALRSAITHLEEKQPKLRDTIREIDSDLDGIGLMHAFPGHCHLCPV
jgi:hypothetical protein